MLKPPFPSITWTAEAEEHIARHGVTPGEVEVVIFERPRWWTPGRDDTTEVFGQTTAGRYLVVIVTEAQDGGTYVVTARDMTDTERSTFLRKGR